MKLYYMPGSCALAAHVAAHEAGLPIELAPVNFSADGRTAGGKDYFTINPKGAVPTLEIEGDILTELSVILLYIADRNPAALPVPASGMARWHFLEMLTFMTTDVHKAFAPIFTPGLADSAKPALLGVVKAKIGLLEGFIGDKPFVSGDSFTILDCYAWLLANWLAFFGLDIDKWPKLKAYHARIGARPAVQKALKEQGLA